MEELAPVTAADSSPDYFDWVLGWRHFQIGEDGTCRSCTPAGGGFVYLPGENKANCAGFNDVVHSGHHCGFNVFFERDNVAYGSLHALVRGRGNRFAIHPNGYRAEYIEILAFVGGRKPSERLKKAAKKYGVPLFKRHWDAKHYAKKNHLGEWFPEERRPGREILRTNREVDWNEVPVGDMTDFLSNIYMIFIIALWSCIAIGFIYGALSAGGFI